MNPHNPERIIREINSLLEYTDFDLESESWTDEHGEHLITVRLYVVDHAGRQFCRSRTIKASQ
jgi:hypothetical protein